VGIERTPSGQPVTCDGCGAVVERVTPAMQHPVPDQIARAIYGRTDLIYIVPGGRHPAVPGPRCAGR